MKYSTLFWVMVFINIIFMAFIFYEAQLYHIAIKVGAENTVTALEMTAACSKAGNVSMETIKAEYLKMFIYPKLNITDSDMQERGK